MIENPPKNAKLSNKVKTTSGFCRFAFFVVVLLHASLRRPQFGLNSVFLAQKCQSGLSCDVPGFQFGCVHPGGRRRAPQSSWRRSVQMRVSWCQRLDGRMLSTFSMMKFRGANSVLRNCGTNMRDGFRSMGRNGQALSSGVFWPEREWGCSGGQIKEATEREREREKGLCVCPHLHLHGSTPGLTNRIITHLCTCCNVHFKVKGVCLKCVWATGLDPRPPH